MFKASLERCPKGAIRLIKEFVSDLKDIDINEEVTFLNKENITGVDISTTIFDVNLQIANNLIELEMQNQKRKYNMTNRMLKYIADLINSSYDKEKDYVHKPCYSVWFLGFKMYDDDSFIHEFEFYDEKRKISLVNDTKIIVVEFVKFKKLDYNNNRWYNIFNTKDLSLLEGDDTVMNDLVDNIKSLNNDNEFVIKIDARERAEREYNARMNADIEESMKQGIEQGKKESKIEIAKKLKQMKLSTLEIMEATGLTKEEIESL
jgi:predicted transposase/invertase (TIGR01784 family)